MLRRPWLLVVAVVAVLTAATALSEDAAPAGPALPALALDPAWSRVEIAPTGTATVACTLTARLDAKLLAIETDCRCLASDAVLPLDLPAGRSVGIALRASGGLPGVKVATFRTTAGAVTAHIQVVSEGLGEGRAALAAACREARERQAQLWLVVHDLRGEARNCGCSGGSLGGIEHLAPLPALVRSLEPTVTARFLLTGDVDGGRTGGESLAARLREPGWTTEHEGVRVSADPVADAARGDAVAIIATVDPRINHARIVRPTLDRGAVALALLVADGQLLATRIVPIDRTLPADPSLLPSEPATFTLDEANPSQRCAGCHQAAHAAWSASRHARAWSSLPEAQRTDACIGCHTTRATRDTLSRDVHCQACHVGSEAHASSGGTARTAGTVECRSCHDARHHPAFAADAAWSAIRHGR